MVGYKEVLEATMVEAHESCGYHAALRAWR